jgi:hypothetical protein
VGNVKTEVWTSKIQPLTRSFWIRIRIGFNQITGSGFWIRIGIQEGKSYPQKRKKLRKFMLWSARCSLLRTEGM